MKLEGQTYVKTLVETLHPSDRDLVKTSPRHYVKVPAPTVHAGVGDALRQAFHMNGEGAALNKFQDLLDRLD